MGYWQRQFYFLSSIGIFYLIIIALFAIPLLGTFVVILIKGALDLRYLILAGSGVVLVALAVFAYRALRRLWHRLRQDSLMAGQDLQHGLLKGSPVEISIFHGLLKLSVGHANRSSAPALVHRDPALLPDPNGLVAGDILERLQRLADLKRAGAIDENEFNQLKAMLIASSATAYPAAEMTGSPQRGNT